MKNLYITFIIISIVAFISCKNQEKKEQKTLIEETEKVDKIEETKKTIENKEAIQIKGKQIIEKNPKNEVTKEIKIIEKKETNLFIINENSVEGIKIGDTFIDHSDKFKRATQENGEGTFEGYNIMDKNANVIGFAFADKSDKSKIVMIEITSSKYKTNEGIAVGSTFGEVKEAYPNSETYGSEIESRTSVKAGNYYFLLENIAFNTYKVDESKIKPSTKIKIITIGK